MVVMMAVKESLLKSMKLMTIEKRKKSSTNHPKSYSC